MNRLLRIADTEAGALASLPAILAPLAPEARGLRWSILDLGEVTAGDSKDLNLPLVEQQVLNSPKGLQLSFDDLTAFAGRVDQVIDGLFVACQWPERLPRRTDDDDAILRKADMLVAAIGSSFWLVGAPDAVLLRLAEFFEQVTDVSTDGAALTTIARTA
jgi:hypothetical protein